MTLVALDLVSKSTLILESSKFSVHFGKSFLDLATLLALHEDFGTICKCICRRVFQLHLND